MMRPMTCKKSIQWLREIQLLECGLLILAIVADVGCSRSSNTQSTKLDQNSPRRSRELFEHDFGLVKPNSTHDHLFRVRSELGKSMEVKQFQAGCRCVVVASKKKRYDPGELVEVLVTYNAGLTSHDELQRIEMEFTDARGPSFVIRAMVRDQLHVSSETVDWRVTIQDENPTKVIIAYNYSDEDWASLHVVTPSWVRCKSVVLRDDAKNLECKARQSWDCTFSILPQDLAIGSHQSVIDFKAEGNDCDVSVPTFVVVAAPFSVYPDRVYLSSSNSQTSSCDLEIAFLGVDPPKASNEFRITNPFLAIIGATITRSNDDRWFMHLTCENREKLQKTGEIIIEIPSITKRSLRIPVELSIE